MYSNAYVTDCKYIFIHCIVKAVKARRDIYVCQSIVKRQNKSSRACLMKNDKYCATFIAIRLSHRLRSYVT